MSKKLKGISAVLGPPLKRAKQHREYCYHPQSHPVYIFMNVRGEVTENG